MTARRRIGKNRKDVINDKPSREREKIKKIKTPYQTLNLEASPLASKPYVMSLQRSDVEAAVKPLDCVPLS